METPFVLLFLIVHVHDDNEDEEEVKWRLMGNDNEE